MEAQLNYLGRMEDHPVAFSYNREAGNLVFDSRAVELRDLRAEPAEDDLARRGIALAQVPFSWPDDETAEANVDAYRDGVLACLERMTGAHRIVLLGPFIRHGDPALAQPGKTPAYYVHGDYTAKSFARSAEQFLEGDPDRERLLAGRMAIYQTWGPLSPAPQDSSLAILDRTTLQAEDLVEGTVVVGTTETPRPHPALLFRHNRAHAWYYASRMEPGDTLIFVGHDNARGALAGCPHTAFACPESGATPRVSAEMRAFVFWG